MSDGFTATSNAQEWVEKFRRYQELSQRSAYECLYHQAANFAFKAHELTTKTAPSKDRLSYQLKMLAMAGNLKIKKQGRTMKQEISARLRSIKSTALGWYLAQRELAKKDLVSRSIDWRTSGISINLRGSNPSIMITSRMKGMKPADAKKEIISEALAASSRDMDVYIRRKTREAAALAGIGGKR